MAILNGCWGEGYDSRDAFSHCRRCGVRTVIRMSIDARTLSDGRTGRAPKQFWSSWAAVAPLHGLLGWARPNVKSAKGSGWPKYNSRWNVEIVISAFKRLLGEPVRAVKPLYIQIDLAAKMAVYNRTRDIMREAMG